MQENRLGASDLDLTAERYLFKLSQSAAARLERRERTFTDERDRDGSRRCLGDHADPTLDAFGFPVGRHIFRRGAGDLRGGGGGEKGGEGGEHG
jgi:hypothetical protein